MCGITGFFRPGGGAESARAVVSGMASALVHRGPDDGGVWVDDAAGIALGHRRLSILDLSPEGHQPMVSASGRYVIAFNGEIYNFRELRREIEKEYYSPHPNPLPEGEGTKSRSLPMRGTEVPEGEGIKSNVLPSMDTEVAAGEGTGRRFSSRGTGMRWRGHSDTEVMLAACECWGIEASLKKFVGMFAFAVWDREERRLHLARDRLGEKPLYYGWMGKTLLFASELKALRAHPAWRGEINRDAVAAYMRHNYIPAPHSIYRGIYKLPPGCLLTLGAEDLRGSSGFSPEASETASRSPRPYWSAKSVAESGVRDVLRMTDDEAPARLDALLRDAVAQQMVADVPLGAFLSGGIDSTTIVALMQAQSNRPVKTFTIGFNESGYNEAQYAKAVARHLGTEHTELYVSPEVAMAVIPKLPTLYDEPFADSSQIPTFLVAQLARQHVTVALSGDGGDELFGGYNRYSWGRNVWRRCGWMPRGLRRMAAAGITTLSPGAWDRLFAGLRPLLPSALRQTQAGDKLHKLARILGARDPEEMYLGLVSHWPDPGQVVIRSREPRGVLGDAPGRAALRDFTQRMMYLDTVTYLPDDILVKVDRAAMAVSLETRVPLLDHRVVEFAWRVPLAMKIRDGQGKWLLRQVLRRYVPTELVERPKMGFGVPIDAWLRGPLRDWAESLLDEARLKREGFFEPAPIRGLWSEHLSGARNWQYHLWDVLMFQAWLEESNATPPPSQPSP
jgi:asparagine synthase (glutamine-hydrolysing)